MQRVLFCLWPHHVCFVLRQQGILALTRRSGQSLIADRVRNWAGTITPSPMPHRCLWIGTSLRATKQYLPRTLSDTIDLQSRVRRGRHSTSGADLVEDIVPVLLLGFCPPPRLIFRSAAPRARAWSLSLFSSHVVLTSLHTQEHSSSFMIAEQECCGSCQPYYFINGQLPRTATAMPLHFLLKMYSWIRKSRTLT